MVHLNCSSLFLTEGMEKFYLFWVLKSRPVGRDTSRHRQNTKQAEFFQTMPSNRDCTVSYRPGVSSIRGMLSSRGSLTISRKAEIPIWPLPMSSWRSRWQPRCPKEGEEGRETVRLTYRHLRLDTCVIISPAPLESLRWKAFR